MSNHTYFPLVSLTTPRLTLRRLTMADVPAIFAIFSHPEVMRYWSEPPWRELAQAEESVQSVMDGYQSGGWLRLGIERNEDHALIGVCTFFSFDRTCRRAELGYAMGRDYWGAGYMNEALIAFINYGFRTVNLNRIEADIDPRNLASAKTLVRLGFQYEGLLRERWIVNGEISDTGFYGLLQRDWELGSV